MYYFKEELPFFFLAILSFEYVYSAVRKTLLLIRFDTFNIPNEIQYLVL